MSTMVAAEARVIERHTLAVSAYCRLAGYGGRTVDALVRVDGGGRVGVDGRRAHDRQRRVERHRRTRRRGARRDARGRRWRRAADAQLVDLLDGYSTGLR